MNGPNSSPYRYSAALANVIVLATANLIAIVKDLGGTPVSHNNTSVGILRLETATKSGSIQQQILREISKFVDMLNHSRFKN